jgi:antirestriction protein ArdC
MGEGTRVRPTNKEEHHMGKQITSNFRKSRYTRRKKKSEGNMVEGANGLLKPYQVITDRIITMLEQGTVPWHKPWGIDGQPKSLASGKPYRGINIFILNCVAQAAGYKSAWWLTFNQVKERGGTVRKGEHATPVVFWKILEREAEIADSDEPSIRKIPMLRYFQVFNVEQCDGIEYPKPQLIEKPFDPIITCEQLIAGVPNPPEIRHGGSQAFYRPSQDLLNMPGRELFESPEEYYCTLFHELIHATGHEKRLARESLKEMAPFGSPSSACGRSCRMLLMPRTSATFYPARLA